MQDSMSCRSVAVVSCREGHARVSPKSATRRRGGCGIESVRSMLRIKARSKV